MIRSKFFPAILAAFAALTPCRPVHGQAIADSGIAFISAANVQHAREGSYLYVRGRVVSISEPAPDALPVYTIFVADASGMVRVEMVGEVFRELKGVAPNAVLEVYGRVSRAGSEQRLVIDKARYIRAAAGTAQNLAVAAESAPKGPAPLVTVSSIGIPAIGKVVRIRGQVTQYRRAREDENAARLVIDDGTGTVDVYFPASYQETLPADRAPKLAKPLEVTALVREEGGKVSLHVRAAQGMLRPDMQPAKSQAENIAEASPKP